MGLDFTHVFKGMGQEEAGGGGDTGMQSLLGWRHSFISSAHGSLLINTTKEGAGDPDDI